jgi:methylphosphotriester-DNA--protein-cysteine methyltransferase
MNPPKETGATVIDEVHMEQFTNDQLAYKAWVGTDNAQEILFTDDADADCLQDAKYEVAFACTALRVLVRRLTGMAPEALAEAIRQRNLEALILKPEIEQFPAWGTKQ